MVPFTRRRCDFPWTEISPEILIVELRHVRLYTSRGSVLWEDDELWLCRRCIAKRTLLIHQKKSNSSLLWIIPDGLEAMIIFIVSVHESVECMVDCTTGRGDWNSHTQFRGFEEQFETHMWICKRAMAV